MPVYDITLHQNQSKSYNTESSIGVQSLKNLQRPKTFKEVIHDSQYSGKGFDPFFYTNKMKFFSYNTDTNFQLQMLTNEAICKQG